MSEKTFDPIEEMKKDFRRENILLSSRLFHTGTPSHGNKKRGVGITRKNKQLSKKKLGIQKNSVKINRNKKRHHMTKKEKKAR